MISTLRELNMRGPVRSPAVAMPSMQIPTGRWISLAAVGAALVIDRCLGGATAALAEQLAERTALAPARLLVAAWPTLLVALVAHGAFQLAEDQRGVEVHDRVSRYVAGFGALTIVAAIASTSNLVVAAGAWLAAAVVIGQAYRRVHHELAAGRAPAWLGALFGAALAMATAFAIGAADAAIAAAGCPSSAPTCALVIGGAVIAVRLGLALRDWVFPGVLALDLLMVCSHDRTTTGLAGAALLAGFACAAAAIALGGLRLLARPATAPATPVVVRRFNRLR